MIEACIVNLANNSRNGSGSIISIWLSLAWLKSREALVMTIN